MVQPKHSCGDDDVPERESAAFPCLYELRVRGRISQFDIVWFEGMSLSVDDVSRPPQTVIRSDIPDHAALYGLISRIRDLGLTLLSVKRIELKEEE
jgi:hypothetical protein